MLLQQHQTLGMTQAEKRPRLETLETGRWENNLACFPPLTGNCGTGWMAVNSLGDLGRMGCGAGVGMRTLEREQR